jgi:cell division protein FtsL
MSTLLNSARALRPTISLPRPKLTIVPKVRSRAPRVPFVMLVVTVLGAGLVGLLLLNTALQRGAYHVTDLQSRAKQLAIQQQNLEVAVADLSQPQSVAEKAVKLGMVKNPNPAFIDLSTGEVLGLALPGAAGDAFQLGQAPPVRVIEKVDQLPSLRVPPTASERQAQQQAKKPANQQRTNSGDTKPRSTTKPPARVTNESKPGTDRRQ